MSKPRLFVFLILFISRPVFSQSGPGVAGAALFLLGEGAEKAGASGRVIHPVSMTALKYTVPHTRKTAYFLLNEKLTWTCPPQLTIEDISPKIDEPSKVFILLSNGDVYRSDIEFGANWLDARWSIPQKVGTGVEKLTGSPGEAELIGDALYIKDGPLVYVSRDTAQTWEVDTVGLSGYVNGIAVDSNNFVWAATGDGVFTQHPDSNNWIKNTTFPTNNCRSLLIDRIGRIFVGAFDVYKSTDGGMNWETIPGVPITPVTSLSDDAFGNIYALGFSGGARAVNAAAPWTNISDTIAAAVTPSTGSFVRTTGIVNAISGDTLLSASTIYGGFTSSDQGDTWEYESNENQLPAYKIYGVVRAGPYYLVSTNLGVYRVSVGDSVFTKVLPATGFISSISLATDSAGNIYSIVPVAVSTFTTTADNYKSTDNGTTWFRDSAGLGQFNIAFRNNPYFVDNEGTQYVGNSPVLWSKRTGDPWRLDTLGLNFAGSERITDVSTNNTKGVVYALKRISSTNYELYSRPLIDSTWQKIDVSAFGATALRFSSDNNGDIILFTRSGEMNGFDGSTWTPIPLPAGIAGPAYAGLVAVNKTGVIWGSFRDSSNSQPAGLYYSGDMGGSWTYAGLDSITISSIVSDEDTTYAVTDIDGLFGYTATGPGTAVDWSRESTVQSFELSQNYPNPFNPVTSISYSLPTKGMVGLTVFNILGQEIAVLVNEVQEAGLKTVSFDAGNLPSGVYTYRITAGGFSDGKKMLLIK